MCALLLEASKSIHDVKHAVPSSADFPGGAIAMPKMLADGGVEYDDGTPASESQMAKVFASLLCG